MIVHHKCNKQQWIHQYQLFGVLKNEIIKSDTIRKRNNIHSVLSLVSRRKTVICSPLLLLLLSLFIYLIMFAQLVWLLEKTFFFCLLLLSSYFLFRCLCVCVCFVFSPSTHKHISLYSYWVCCDFLCRLESIRDIRNFQRVNYRLSLCNTILLFSFFLLHFSLCVYTIFLVKLFCFCIVHELVSNKTRWLFIICPVELYVCVSTIFAYCYLFLSGSSFDYYT
jgi:hypothetical protein